MMDIALDANNDLMAVGGDWGVVESTAAHQKNLLLLAQGELPYAPLVGVGLVAYEDDENPSDALRAITQQFMQDGMEIVELVPNPASVSDNTERPFIGAYYE